MTTRQERAEQTRARVLESAVKVFSSKRYEDVQMKHISELAGVSHGVMFHYFDSKRGMYIAAVNEIADYLFDIPLPDKEQTPFLRIRTMLTNFCERLSSNESLFRSYVDLGLASDYKHGLDEGSRTGAERLIWWIYDIAELPRDSTSPHMMLHVVTASIDKLVYDWLAKGKPYEIERLVEASVALIIGALRAAEALDPDISINFAVKALSIK